MEQLERTLRRPHIFDSWAGVLTPGDFAEFALPYVQDIIKALKPAGVPLIYFANN
ncbi:MAG: uroporphyrinogen decarboxylase family protein, partial [Pseudomonadota bacterium]